MSFRGKNHCLSILVLIPAVLALDAMDLSTFITTGAYAKADNAYARRWAGSFGGRGFGLISGPYGRNGSDL